jgi:hypothetical protein
MKNYIQLHGASPTVKWILHHGRHDTVFSGKSAGMKLALFLRDKRIGKEIENLDSLIPELRVIATDY